MDRETKKNPMDRASSTKTLTQTRACSLCTFLTCKSHLKTLPRTQICSSSVANKSLILILYLFVWRLTIYELPPLLLLLQKLIYSIKLWVWTGCSLGARGKGKFNFVLGIKHANNFIIHHYAICASNYGD